MKHSFSDPSNAGRDASASLGFPRISSGGPSALRASGPNTYNPSQPIPPGRAAFGVFAPPGDGQAIDHWRDWQAHVDAGRIGSLGWPTASLLEAGNPPMSERHRKQIEAQERQFRRLFGG